MTRIRVNGVMYRAELNDGKYWDEYVGGYFSPSVADHDSIWLEGDWGFEVIPPAHRGGYDPNHWGELNPDAYDRMTYANSAYWYSEDPFYAGHGRHLLDTGVN